MYSETNTNKLLLFVFRTITVIFAYLLPIVYKIMLL